MAVVSVTEVVAARMTTMRAEGLMFVRDHIRQWLVITDNPADSSYVAATAPGLPTYGSRYPDDFLATCRSVTSTVSDRDGDGIDGRLWNVTTMYTTAPIQGSQQQMQRPEDIPVKRSVRSVSRRVVIERDRDNKKILTKSRVPYDPPLMLDAEVAVLSYLRCETFDPMTRMLAVNNKINSHGWKGQAAGTWLCKFYAEEDFAFDTQFWRCSYNFHHRPDGWQPNLLEQAMSYRMTTSGASRPILDENKFPVQEPVMLDSSGNPLPGGSDPIFTKWNVYHEFDFNVLGL